MAKVQLVVHLHDAEAPHNTCAPLTKTLSEVERQHRSLYTLHITLVQVLTYAYSWGMQPHRIQYRKMSRILAAASTSRCTVVLEDTLSGFQHLVHRTTGSSQVQKLTVTTTALLTGVKLHQHKELTSPSSSSWIATA